MSETEENLYKQIQKSIDKSSKITIISHTNPDGDAIGSALGLYHYIIQLDKDVMFLSPDRAPGYLNWMPDVEKAMIAFDARKASIGQLNTSDLIFCVDFNDPARIGDLDEVLLATNAKKILIDHHPEPMSFADIVFSDTKASSTAELVFKLIESVNQKYLNKNIAECLYVGLMTDTGSFNYNSSEAYTYYCVSRLLEFGIDKDRIYSNVYDNFSEHRMRFLGYCLLEKMEYIPDFNTAYISLSQNELKEFSFQQGDTEGFVNYPLSIKGVVFTALFIEKKDKIKISFRSKGDFAANEFAKKHFFGGGHKNAAGGHAFESLNKTIEKFKKVLTDYQDELSKQDIYTD